MTIDDQEVYKIGITNRSIEQRVCEILTSHFGIYRHFPYCRPKRFRRTPNAYEYEQMLLKYFKDYQYHPYSQFSGSTELISGIELDEVVRVYEYVYDNGKLPEEEENDTEVKE